MSYSITSLYDRLTSVQIIYPHLSYVYMHKCVTKGRRWYILYTVKALGPNAIPVKKLTVVTYGCGGGALSSSSIHHFALPAPACLNRSWKTSSFKRYFMAVTSDYRLIICMKKYSIYQSNEGYIFEYVKN